MNRNSIRVAVSLALTLILPVVANAIPMLRLTNSGGPSTTVVDQGGLDLNAVVGAVTFSGPLGPWSVNVTTGVTFPVLPPLTMDLNSINVSSTGPATLVIEFTDDFAPGTFPVGVVGFLHLIGGTLGPLGGGATLTYEALAGVSAFGSQIGTSGPFVFSTPGAFSGSFSNTFGLPGLESPLWLTQKVTITHASNNITSFNGLLQVPEPLTVALLGAGLLAARVFTRRRSRLNK